nr:anaerobic glycerol-3-phosphate dehydrogenase subunit A [Chloroflexota bacterium]
MRSINTEVLVIGGGATGTGILRDLAMRGFDAVLVEARDLTHGTTGRFHGLLHSGGRYALKDPQAAKECIEENTILRRIMPHCIEDVGGFFVVTPWDEPEYADSFLAGCRVAEIPIEEISIDQMLADEPLLNPEISRCFRVPDGAADSFAAAHANVASAREYGAKVRTYHEVTGLISDSSQQTSNVQQPASKVIGALCHDLVNDDQVAIHADLVINAAGAWVGKIGASAGVEIAIRPGKGTMVAVSQRIVNTVINRCKMPADGDILVPAHTVAVMGTTDEQVPDPDSFAIEPWEVQLMLKEGEKIIPGFKEMRMLRAWAGVRPLYQETKTNASRDIARSYVLLDHEERDGVSGMITITSGKWTTYRKMAEAAVDLVCEKMDTKRECRTHLEYLPNIEHTTHQITAETQRAQRKYSSNKPSRSWCLRGSNLGERLSKIETERTYGQLICECELATCADIERAINEDNAKTLDDIRRDVRLGMGPCQGGFCTMRAAGILHQGAVDGDQWSVEQTNVSLRDFLEERWKGVLPVLWGKQLHQERLNELIYINVLNVEHLPGPKASPLAAQPYSLSPSHPPSPLPRPALSQDEGLREGKGAWGVRGEGTIVIGAGLAGLTAAWQSAQQGGRTKIIAKGWGATHWASGCIDVLGYHAHKRAENPKKGIQNLITENPQHPYALIGLEKLADALTAFQELCQASGYPLHGSLEQNWMLPTAVGAIRPTCLAPETMIAGDLRSKEPMVIIGFEGYHDFFPHYAAANLEAQGYTVRAVIIDPSSLRSRKRVDTMILARLFDQEDFRAEVADEIKPHLKDVNRVGFPAVLGLKNPLEVLRDLESRLGCKVFEMPGLPPSVPGIRLHNILLSAIQKAGGRVENGMEVLAYSNERGAAKNCISTVWTESAARRTPHNATKFVLATGGFLGDGIKSSFAGYVQESVFNLPVHNLTSQDNWLQREFFHDQGHSIFTTGISVDNNFCPVDQDGKIMFNNLAIIGSALGYGDFIRERCLEGIA